MSTPPVLLREQGTFYQCFNRAIYKIFSVPNTNGTQEIRNFLGLYDVELFEYLCEKKLAMFLRKERLMYCHTLYISVAAHASNGMTTGPTFLHLTLGSDRARSSRPSFSRYTWTIFPI